MMPSLNRDSIALRFCLLDCQTREVKTLVNELYALEQEFINKSNHYASYNEYYESTNNFQNKLNTFSLKYEESYKLLDDPDAKEIAIYVKSRLDNLFCSIHSGDHLYNHETCLIAKKFYALTSQISKVKMIVKRLYSLQEMFNETSSQICSQFSDYVDFQRKLQKCRLKWQNIHAHTTNPTLKEIHAFVLTQFKQLNGLLPTTCPPFIPENDLPIIADKFQLHRTQEAFEDFHYFASVSRVAADQIYKKLWFIKGASRELKTHQAEMFYNWNGYHSLNIEKAEAIRLFLALIKDWLLNIQDLFAENQLSSALFQLKELSRIYPKIADCIFDKIAQLNGLKDTISSHALAIDPQRIFLFNDTDPYKNQEAMEWACSELRKALTPVFLKQQDSIRKDIRCAEIIKTHLSLLKQHGYDPQGKQFPSEDFLPKTRIVINGVGSPRRARFHKTTHEIRHQPFISVAYDLALNPQHRVALLNIGNDTTPGGRYLHEAGSHEEELFRCTGLPFDLDHRLKMGAFDYYPIHDKHHAGMRGCLFTARVPLVRRGYDCDYALVPIPRFVSVGTFAEPASSSKIPIPKTAWIKERVRSFLSAAYDNHDNTVLICLNSLTDIGQTILEVIGEEYLGCFEKIVFTLSSEGPSLNGEYDRVKTLVKAFQGSIYDANGIEMKN